MPGAHSDRPKELVGLRHSRSKGALQFPRGEPKLQQVVLSSLLLQLLGKPSQCIRAMRSSGWLRPGMVHLPQQEECCAGLPLGNVVCLLQVRVVADPEMKVGILAGLNLARTKLWGLVPLQLVHLPPPGANVRARVSRKAVQGHIGAFPGNDRRGRQWWAEGIPAGQQHFPQ